MQNNILGISFFTQYIPTVHILYSKIPIKDKYSRMKNTALTFFERINKQPLFFSNFYPIYNQERNHLETKPLSGNVYKFLIKQVHQYEKEHNQQHLIISDLKFRSIHKVFRVTISSIKYMKDSKSDMISLHIYNNSQYKITLPLEVLTYCETNATISPSKEIAYRVN